MPRRGHVVDGQNNFNVSIQHSRARACIANFFSNTTNRNVCCFKLTLRQSQLSRSRSRNSVPFACAPVCLFGFREPAEQSLDFAYLIIGGAHSLLRNRTGEPFAGAFRPLESL